jgi:uncharacterized membrane protein YeaQ/YmgE (transglycosylase-associated protein family)
MDSVALVVQMLSGFIGANATRLLFKNLHLDFLKASLAGTLGGFLGGQLLQLLLGFDDKPSPQLLLTSVAGGAIGAVVAIAAATWAIVSSEEH